MIDQTHALMAGTRKMLYLQGISISGSFNSVLSKINLKISRNQDALHKSRELLTVHARQYLNRKSAEIGNAASLIRIMDPMNLLKKGFAIIQKQGIIQINANAIHENDHITIKMMDQTLEATVLNKQSNDGK
jgi:exodeoxyribonuclease VII large subunit